jgi:serine/threonine-protein kinase
VSDESLRDLFERARDLEEVERERLLAEFEAAGHPRAADLARLLAAAEAPRSPLDADPFGVLEDDALPARIGPFRILRELGRGGMGRVFLAEQTGDGFRRDVALKVIAGGARADVERRARDEQRILAALEHPGIARFYDAGRTAEGDWYLALEYVEGRDLLDHVRSRDLPLAERLRLLLDVLDAVAYAHARGVVHRDLKPGNILVSADGRPRLLDFGIAKLVEPGPETEPSVTRTGFRAMTPAYASPEQFRGEPVTVASDVFSLGVVLYELVTGARPFAPGARSASEIERAVLAGEPELPSTAARRTTTAEATDHASAPVHGRRWTAGLRRDLDAICLKALAKRPAERYPSAAELAADLGALLEGRPVSARGGGGAYRLARLLRRRRSELVTAAALAIAVGALLFAVAPRRAASPVPGAPAHRTPFPARAGDALPLDELRRSFAAAPDDAGAGARLALALASRGEGAEAAIVVGRLRQLPDTDDPLIDYAAAVVATHLDEPQRALALFDRALRHAVEGGRPELVARLRLGRARSHSDLGQTAEALVDLEAAIEEARRSGEESTLAIALNDLAVERLMAGDWSGGEQLLEEALGAARAADDRPRLGLILQNLGGLAFQRGRPDLAETRLREAIAAHEALGRERHAATSRADLAQAIRDQERWREADGLLDTAVEQLRRFDHATSLAYALAARAEVAVARLELDEAGRIADEIERGARTSGNPASLGLAERVRALAAAARGDLDGARARFEGARRLFVDSGNLDLAAEAEVAEAASELDAGRSERAANLLDPAPAGLAVAPADGTAAFVAATLRVRISAATGRPGEAAAILDGLGDGSASPSRARRIAYLRARAELVAARGGDPRPDLEAALAAAASIDHRLAAERIAARLAGVGGPATVAPR